MFIIFQFLGTKIYNKLTILSPQSLQISLYLVTGTKHEKAQKLNYTKKRTSKRTFVVQKRKQDSCLKKFYLF